MVREKRALSDFKSAATVAHAAKKWRRMAAQSERDVKKTKHQHQCRCKGGRCAFSEVRPHRYHAHVLLCSSTAAHSGNRPRCFPFLIFRRTDTSQRTIDTNCISEASGASSLSLSTRINSIDGCLYG